MRCPLDEELHPDALVEELQLTATAIAGRRGSLASSSEAGYMVEVALGRCHGPSCPTRHRSPTPISASCSGPFALQGDGLRARAVSALKLEVEPREVGVCESRCEGPSAPAPCAIPVEEAVVMVNLAVIPATDDANMSDKKRKQHFVWEHYLSEWARNGHLFCDREGARFSPSTGNVAHERDFYRIHDLSDEDVAYVRAIAERLPEPGPMLAKSWIDFFQLPTKFRRLYESGSARSSDIEKKLDTLYNNLEEDLHCKFEGDAVPLLALLKKRDASALSHEIMGQRAMMFLALQYQRTPRMVKGISGVDAKDLPGFNIEATNGLLRAIYATVMANWMYVRQDKVLATFLLADNEHGFITGDQPVINTRALADDNTTAEFYYPLSPGLALLLAFDARQPTTREVVLTVAQIRHYNQLIVSARDKLVFAASKADLDASM